MRISDWSSDVCSSDLVKQKEAEQTLAVVAVKSLAAYQPIARDAVALVPVSVKPTDPFTTLDEVVGKQPLIDVDAGAPVTRRYFREGNLLARAIPAGYQAISISVTDVLARSEEHTSELQSLMRISYAV